MESNTNVKINKLSPIVMVSVGVILFLMAVVLIFTRKLTPTQEVNNTQNGQQTIAPTTKSSVERFGKLDISVPTINVSSGQDVTVIISGDSMGKEIVGYDSLVVYDKTALTLQSAKSTIKDFTIFKFDRPSHLSLTAVKNLNSKTPTILNKTPMVELVFQAVKSGTFPIVIQSNIDKESTKMVDEKTNVLYPNLSSVMVTVK